MKLIVGLGNPGRHYSLTRHNIGFRVLDHFAKNNDIKFKTKRLYDYGIWGSDAVIIKPLTFMNLSGKAVQKAVKYFSVSSFDKLLVVYDDIYLNLGSLKIKQKGSAGGHKGVLSIIQALSTDEFARIKIGIGYNENVSDDSNMGSRQKSNKDVTSEIRNGRLSEYVLSKFSHNEQPLVEKVVQFSSELIEEFIEKNYQGMINYYSINK